MYCLPATPFMNEATFRAGEPKCSDIEPLIRAVLDLREIIVALGTMPRYTACQTYLSDERTSLVWIKQTPLSVNHNVVRSMREGCDSSMEYKP